MAGYIVLSLFLLVSVLTNIWLFVRYRNRSKEQELVEKCKESEKKYSDLKEYAQRLLNMCKTLENIKRDIPEFNTRINLKERIGALERFWFGYYNNKQIFSGSIDEARYANSEALFNDLRRTLAFYGIIRAMQSKITKPFADLLSCTDVEPSADELKVEFLKMSVRLYDVVHSFKNGEAPFQLKTGIDILEGKITEEKAYDQARIFTDIEEDTPRWARRLARCLRALGLEKERMVFSGFKFEETEAGGDES